MKWPFARADRAAGTDIEVLGRDASYPVLFQEYVDFLTSFQGMYYPINNLQQTLTATREEISTDFNGLTSRAYKSNPVVFACMETRRSHFTEARFIFRQRRNGRPGNLFTNSDLKVLEEPYGPGSTTGDLLSRLIQDVDLAGNCYHVRDGDILARLRPDWVAIILGSRIARRSWIAGDPDTEVLGYMYFPGGKPNQEKPLLFNADEVAHFSPIPDPQANFLGMSWLTTLIREVQSDQMMTEHKTKYLEQGATPNLIVTFPPGTSRENFEQVVQTIKGGHEGYQNAYKTLFLAGGADAKALGANLQQSDFRAVQGAGETRIAAAARTPAVMVGLSEGLQGSSLNAGNYQAARRMFADGTMRHLWRNAAGALTKIVKVPRDAELWYDDRDIAFLKEDLKDTAQVQVSQTTAIGVLIDKGFEPDAAVVAITTDDLSSLSGKHSGLLSVQLHPMDGQPPAPTNGGTATPSTGGTAAPAGG